MILPEFGKSGSNFVVFKSFIHLLKISWTPEVYPCIIWPGMGKSGFNFVVFSPFWSILSYSLLSQHQTWHRLWGFSLRLLHRLFLSTFSINANTWTCWYSVRCSQNYWTFEPSFEQYLMRISLFLFQIPCSLQKSKNVKAHRASLEEAVKTWLVDTSVIVQLRMKEETARTWVIW